MGPGFGDDAAILLTLVTSQEGGDRTKLKENEKLKSSSERLVVFTNYQAGLIPQRHTHDPHIHVNQRKETEKSCANDPTFQLHS